MIHHDDGSIELVNHLQKETAAEALSRTCAFVTPEALMMFWDETPTEIKIPAKFANKVVEGLMVEQNTAESRWGAVKTIWKRHRAAQNVKELGITAPATNLRLLSDVHAFDHEERLTVA